MDEATILNILRAYIVEKLLEGDDNGLDAETPLLEWGLLNSMEMLKLVAFIEEQFRVVLPPRDLMPEHFRTLGSATRLVNRYTSSRGGLP
jgi:acyl carrier protein